METNVKDLKGAIVFTAIVRNENPTLEGREYSPAIIIDTVDEIIYVDPKTKEVTNEIIRYKPGEKSILLKEQNGKYDDKGKIVKYDPIIIYDGNLIADEREILMLKYLRACNANLNLTYGQRMPNKTAIFKERNEAKEADVYLAEEKADRALLNMIDSMEVDEMVALALVLGDAFAATKVGSEIRRDLILFAKKSPKKLRDKMNNANVARKVHILRALGDGFVKFDPNTRMVTWENGNEISQCPIGMEAADYLVELSFQPAYETMYASIEHRVKPESVAVTENTTETNGVQTDAEIMKTIDEKDLDTLISEAIEKKILIRRGVWYGLTGRKKGVKYHTIDNGIEKLKLSVEVDEKLQAIIKQKLFDLE